jgi:formate-dependent nitrite reductase cytochrome c552 subunit
MAYKDPKDPRNLAKKREHYRANSTPYKERRTARKADMREWLDKLKDVACLDCGKSYPPYVMDFDHRDPSQKEGNIGWFLNNGSWAKLKAEVAKCDVVCSNCHRERTHGR